MGKEESGFTAANDEVRNLSLRRNRADRYCKYMKNNLNQSSCIFCKGQYCP